VSWLLLLLLESTSVAATPLFFYEGWWSPCKSERERERFSLRLDAFFFAAGNQAIKKAGLQSAYVFSTREINPVVFFFSP
jgi:hypothetical protein